MRVRPPRARPVPRLGVSARCFSAFASITLAFGQTLYVIEFLFNVQHVQNTTQLAYHATTHRAQRQLQSSPHAATHTGSRHARAHREPTHRTTLAPHMPT